MIPLFTLVTSPIKLRQTIDDALISELAETIEDKGIIETLIVRRQPSGRYQIVVGEQRYRAAQKAELMEVPCIVKKLNDREASEISLIENNQRKNITDYERARKYRNLFEKLVKGGIFCREAEVETGLIRDTDLEESCPLEQALHHYFFG